MVITICGAGVVGSHLADNLARQGFRRLRVIDNGRVSADGVAAALYGARDVGAWKMDVLRQRIFRDAEVEIDACRKALTERSAAKLLAGSALVIDCLDNETSQVLVRTHCFRHAMPCLHVRVSDVCGTITWTETSACSIAERPSRNLVLLMVALATEAVQQFVRTGEKVDRRIGLEQSFRESSKKAQQCPSH